MSCWKENGDVFRFRHLTGAFGGGTHIQLDLGKERWKGNVCPRSDHSSLPSLSPSPALFHGYHTELSLHPTMRLSLLALVPSDLPLHSAPHTTGEQGTQSMPPLPFECLHFLLPTQREHFSKLFTCAFLCCYIHVCIHTALAIFNTSH